jgi:hypothetical protein
MQVVDELKVIPDWNVKDDDDYLKYVSEPCK